MKKVFTNASISEIEYNCWGHKKPSVSSYFKVISIAIFAFLLNFGSANAQCNAVMPFICITTNPAASGVTTTTVDISAASSQSHWQWLDRVGVVWSTSANPTITTNMGIQMVTLPASSTLTGTMPAFTITGLTPGTTYYLRAFGTYSYPSEAATFIIRKLALQPLWLAQLSQ